MASPSPSPLQEQAKELEKIVQGYRQEIDVYKAKAKAAESAAASAGAELAAIDTAHFAKLEELLVERTEQVGRLEGVERAPRGRDNAYGAAACAWDA